MAMQFDEIEKLYSEEATNDSFRDHLATVDEEGKRIWVYPKMPKGSFFKKRSVVSFLLLTFLFVGPFLKIGGQPFLLLNVIDRKFVILGQVFWPHDFHLFAIALITMVVFIILFTVVYGRVFCGWVCPQTIFMEFVFRRVEYLIEGDYMKQKKLDKAPWTSSKIAKKTAKHVIFLLISVAIMHTFMSYLIGIERTWEIIRTPPGENMGGFSAMIVLSGLFYGVFGWFREQVCTTVCPYGRLQGVLLDKNSTVIAYDYKRGEKRGKLRKNEDRTLAEKGDCIDCKQCVFVCPTGIDIRNGTQLECINCTACIDACDDIMEKTNQPKGLIRYASEAGIREQTPFKFTKRMIAYSVVLLLLLTLSGSQLLIRSDIETTILRAPGILYQEREDGTLSNLYNVKLLNKTNETVTVTLQPIDEGVSIEVVNDRIITIEPNENYSGAFFLILGQDKVKKSSTPLRIGVFKDGEKVENVSTRFLGPVIN